MGSLSNSYKLIKPAVVAIAGTMSSEPDFPPIIGSGVIVREDGIIFTNDHVVRAINELPRRPGAAEDEWPAVALMLHLIPGKGTAVIPLAIKGAVLPIGLDHRGAYYGEKTPDVGIIRVDVRGLPTASVSKSFTLDEGDQIGAAGFPMGTETLRAPGWVHQLSPTLQTGVVSAILPMVCDNPHAVLLDMVVEGGSSGSPVFDASTGEVVGLVYAGLDDVEVLRSREGRVLTIGKPTSHTLAIPCNWLNRLLDKLDSLKPFIEHKIEFQAFEDLLKQEPEMLTPKRPWLKPIGGVEMQ